MAHAGDISPKSRRMPLKMKTPRKALAALGRLSREHSPSRAQMDDEDSISPWADPPAQNKIAPWDSDPQAHLAGTRPFDQTYFNDVSHHDDAIAPFPAFRSSNSAASTPESNHFDQDVRRPSLVSETTASSAASRNGNNTGVIDDNDAKPGGKFRRKNLNSLLGDEPPSDTSTKSSEVSLGDNLANGHESERSTIRKGSTTKSIEESRPRTPQPQSDVTPWAYQNFDDVSNFGAAPVRPELIDEETENSKRNGAAAAPHRKGILHRHGKSKDEPVGTSLAPATSANRPSPSQESSSTNALNVKGSPKTASPMHSSANLGPVSSHTAAKGSENDHPPEKRSFLSKVLHRNRDKHSQASAPPKAAGPPPPQAPLPSSAAPTATHTQTSNGKPARNRAFSKDKNNIEEQNQRDRETSVASADSVSTVKAIEPTPTISRTFTASSMANRFHRPSKKRGQSYASETSEKPQSEKSRGSTSVQQAPTQAGIFSLDTNFDDLSDIVAKAPKPAEDTGAGRPSVTPSQELGAPIWDAPDSWAVKGSNEETKTTLPEDQAEGLPPIDEEDGVAYFMRVFRTDGTFATLSMTINATVGEVLQSLAKKSMLHDPIDNYQLLLRKNQLARQMAQNERPIAMQKKLLFQAGYEESDRIEEIGREDNSYLCRFTFSHEKQTGFGSGLENDPVFNKMQKFSHIDLSGRSLVTIPILLYRRAPEIISLNLSRNLALSVPKDFITACTNLREIKFTGNEAWRLPPSLSSAGRVTILDVSNNRLDQLDHADLHRVMGLVSLKLANNALSDLPQNYGNFRQLRSLNMSSNNFRALPDHICGLRALVDLDISFNKISHLPAKISQLKTLERLWMTNNELKGPLPESLKDLINLKEIDARFNGITTIDNVSGLPNLEQLLMGHNSVTTFKGSFKKLRNLVLDHCPMTSFEVDEPVPTLSSLNIASANLVEFKESIFEFLPNLQRLNLDKNHFSNIASQIGRLSKLESLSMAKNKLNVIPASIGSLAELKFLNLRECNIKSLPPEIWYCKKLETLNLSSNLLETFPKQNAAPPPSDGKENQQAATPALSSSPSFEELGKLEDFQARRPSQASAGMLSIGSSPGGSHRKNSVSSMNQSGIRKMSAISRTNTEVSMSTATRKDSNLSQVRLQNTFAGSLRYLYLADNRLEDEVFREIAMCPELRMLNLSYNEIDDFPQGVLRRWPHMTDLYLSGNLLTSLPSDDLEENSNLRILHLNANRFQVLPAELCNVHKLSTLDVGSNALKYNVSNWPYDWNWNRNTNLKYLNFSANKRLEIKPSAHPNQPQYGAMAGEVQDLTSFNSLKYLRVLGLMDVTLLTNTIPDDNDDRRVRTSASLAGSLLYGMADTIGKNDHLSTLDLLKPNFRGHEAEIVVGMFDGQTVSSGGSKIAKYLHENFSHVFTAELDKLEKGSKDTPSDALRRTFLSLNKDMANYASSNIDIKEHRLANGHRGSIVANSLTQDDLATGGSATILYLNNTELYVANVGDIETILIQSTGQYRKLTVKHDPAEPRERERIRAAGGYVSRQGKLNDQLEISRAFGYFPLMPSVIAAPHTINFTLSDSDELLVLASKEFWDYVTVDLAVDVARAEKGDLMFAAQKLRDLAMAYGARDKIMVMVLGVSDLRKRNNNRYRGQSLSMAKELGGDDGQIFPSSRLKRKKGETMVGDSKLARLEEVEAPVGSVAIVFTDIKNSTALWEVLPVPMRSAISIHNELMRRQLRIIGGYEVKTEGDAFMCSFPTATSALLWCFSCQSHLLELPWPTEILDTVHCQEKFDADHNSIYRGLSVRMGIHWGSPVCDLDPITRRMDYFGPMVNKAARVSAVADGGQITVSTDFISEIMGTLESFAEEDRRDSVGSQDTTTVEDAVAERIRRELRQLSTQGFEVKDLGEKKLKGLENPEFIYLMYPHSLAGRLTMSPGAPEKPSVAANEGDAKGEPGALGQDSQLSHEGLNLDEVWKLWDIALRLEMLCSYLESPEKEVALRKPELSLLNKVKDRGGVVSDAFMLNLLEHQVTRVESCITSLQIRHMLQPLRHGSSLADQAKPMHEILAEVGKALAAYQHIKDSNADAKPVDMKEMALISNHTS